VSDPFHTSQISPHTVLKTETGAVSLSWASTTVAHVAARSAAAWKNDRISLRQFRVISLCSFQRLLLQLQDGGHEV
jgi:predicted ribosome quality control (RQC) complex YloA/Tae2 family protein